MDRKIYSRYAFTENEAEKRKINIDIYKELKQKYKILETDSYEHKQPTHEELEKNDIVYSRKACYHKAEYKIYKCPEKITLDELALICDGDIFVLVFGYSGNKIELTVFED